MHVFHVHACLGGVVVKSRLHRVRFGGEIEIVGAGRNGEGYGNHPFLTRFQLVDKGCILVSAAGIIVGATRILRWLFLPRGGHDHGLGGQVAIVGRLDLDSRQPGFGEVLGQGFQSDLRRPRVHVQFGL